MIIFQVSKKSLDGKSSTSTILVEGFRHRSHTHDHKYVIDSHILTPFIDSHILIPFNSYPLRGRGWIDFVKLEKKSDYGTGIMRYLARASAKDTGLDFISEIKD